MKSTQTPRFLHIVLLAGMALLWPVSASLNALESVIQMPVDLDVNSKFAMVFSPSTGSKLLNAGAQGAQSNFGFDSSHTTINFGTYNFSEALPSQSIEIYCTSNTGNNWQIDISGEALRHQTNGTTLNGSPVYWSFGPAPQNPGDFQQAKGTFGQGSFPTTNVLYRSAAGEMGSGILIVLGLNANIQGTPQAGNYQTSITLTMHE